MCLICDDCKEAKPDVVERPCPYVEDIHGEIELVEICDNCYDLRCDEI